jgi:hypothetical protein
MEETKDTIQTPAETGTDEVKNAETTANNEAKPVGGSDDASSDTDTTVSEPNNDDSKDDVDYKQKFGFSSAENQRITEENNKYKNFLSENGFDPDTLEKTVDTTSDEYLAETVTGFDYMSEQQKQQLREAMTLINDVNGIKKTLAEFTDEKKFESDFKNLTSNEEFKGIDKDKFREFAYKKENLQTPVDVLAKAFLFENKPVVKEEPKPARKGGESGTGGSKEPVTTKEGKVQMTPQEVQKLRVSDPKEYHRLIREKKLDFVVD